MRSASFDRDDVMEKIMNSFWEHGYEATSIQVLEAASGLKRQSLYNAFGNKDAMFELAADRYDRAISAQLIGALDQDDPRAALREFFSEQYAVLSDETQPAGCFVAGGQQELANRSDSALGQKLEALILEQHDGLTAIFARWKSEGKLTPDADPAALAAVLMAQQRGQAVLGRSRAARDIVRQSADTLPQLFERYLV